MGAGRGLLWEGGVGWGSSWEEWAGRGHRVGGWAGRAGGAGTLLWVGGLHGGAAPGLEGQGWERSWVV